MLQKFKIENICEFYTHTLINSILFLIQGYYLQQQLSVCSLVSLFSNKIKCSTFFYCGPLKRLAL